MAHTPGPWIEQHGFVMSPTGDFICDPHLQGGPSDHAERDANARLIAAAPDLLNACELLLVRLQYDQSHLEDGETQLDAPILVLRKAIDKAKGKS